MIDPELPSDGDEVLEGVEPPTEEELEAAYAAELLRLVEGQATQAQERP